MSDEAPRSTEKAAPDESTGETSALPRIDFSTFVLSLAASAMVQLGLAPGLEGDKREAPDLAMARHTIDTIEMLVEKTRGNLDSDEERLLQSVLYEVRMSFVRAERGK
jgi:hypothetical protein